MRETGPLTRVTAQSNLTGLPSRRLWSHGETVSTVMGDSQRGARIDTPAESDERFSAPALPVMARLDQAIWSGTADSSPRSPPRVPLSFPETLASDRMARSSVQFGDIKPGHDDHKTTTRVHPVALAVNGREPGADAPGSRIDAGISSDGKPTSSVRYSP